jgi:hypothetical protein
VSDNILKHARQALSESNARPFDGDDNFKKRLVITTAVVGPGSPKETGSGFIFEAKIPRSAVNELGMTSVWNASTRTEAATFLRELADLIEEGS